MENLNTHFNTQFSNGWTLSIDDSFEQETDVTLPNIPVLASLNGQGNWVGKCCYRRTIKIASPHANERYALYFGAAMHHAVVKLDGMQIGMHSGGYLPFEVDLGESVKDGAEHLLEVELSNEHDASIPPGKPYQDLDFCCYSGLYRGVELRRYASIHITDPVAANEIAGGGVFLRTLRIEEGVATLSVDVDIANLTTLRQRIDVLVEVVHPERGKVADFRQTLHIEDASKAQCQAQLLIEEAELWSPSTPILHQIHVSLLNTEGSILDRVVENHGFRIISFSRTDGFLINGERFRPRGTNRHQDHPYLGYALSDRAQYRDAMRIKEAGFDYVRLSHYPHSPAFMDACDQLGILVMNCIPGWQYLGGESFRQACYDNARDLIRRDRNHSCVVLWELSLNETAMDDAFIKELHRIGHEEYPGDQMATCGWMDGFDVYIHARQHGGIHSWENGDQAMVVSEYGDWEYYAANEGFDQITGAGLLDDNLNSRAFLGDGELKLRQQVINHIEALNDTLGSPALFDGQWCMYDYPRGYHPDRAACGIMDFYRLPKWSYHFYRSQRDPDGCCFLRACGPMVFIASNLGEDAPGEVIVFSNLDQVELLQNGKRVGILKKGDQQRWQHLPHPPYVFNIGDFCARELEAVGYLDCIVVARHCIGTPGEVAKLGLTLDSALPENISFTEEADVCFAYARLLDNKGHLCVTACESIEFEWKGKGGAIMGPKRISTEAGTACVMIRMSSSACSWTLSAKSDCGFHTEINS